MAETKTLTCIRCPRGCAITVTVDTDALASAADAQAQYDAVLSIEGNQCARGKRYALDEATNPTRTVTMTVCVPGALEPLSAKTAAPVPKAQVREVARAMTALSVRLPVNTGDVICENIANTGVAVLATKTLK